MIVHGFTTISSFFKIKIRLQHKFFEKYIVVTEILTIRLGESWNHYFLLGLAKVLHSYGIHQNFPKCLLSGLIKLKCYKYLCSYIWNIHVHEYWKLEESEQFCPLVTRDNSCKHVPMQKFWLFSNSPDKLTHEYLIFPLMYCM